MGTPPEAAFPELDLYFKAGTLGKPPGARIVGVAAKLGRLPGEVRARVCHQASANLRNPELIPSMKPALEEVLTQLRGIGRAGETPPPRTRPPRRRPAL